MPNTPDTQTRRGYSPEWANLPRRHCDNCGKSYKPVRPLRPAIDKFGFCQPNCKKEFHKHGGAFRKLREEMRKLVEKRMREIAREEIAAAHQSP
jgi:hypothetical protein